MKLKNKMLMKETNIPGSAVFTHFKAGTSFSIIVN